VATVDTSVGVVVGSSVEVPFGEEVSISSVESEEVSYTSSVTFVCRCLTSTF